MVYGSFFRELRHTQLSIYLCIHRTYSPPDDKSIIEFSFFFWFFLFPPPLQYSSLCSLTTYLYLLCSSTSLYPSLFSSTEKTLPSSLLSDKEWSPSSSLHPIYPHHLLSLVDHWVFRVSDFSLWLSSFIPTETIVNGYHLLLTEPEKSSSRELINSCIGIEETWWESFQEKSRFNFALICFRDRNLCTLTTNLGIRSG